jgi:ribulose-5-phosphate 4-epimerase/fuculose-1-phosphate aldolase
MSRKPATLHDVSAKPLRGSISAAEWQARVDLAAGYRLCDLYGMSDLIYTHISARVPDRPEHFLINAHGLLFEEITASSLLKVDLDGNVLYRPEGEYGLHQAGFVIHSAIYRARADVGAAMHTHTVAGMAVSALACGLLPLTQTATRFCSRLAYHDFNGPERDPAEREALARDLRGENYMILRNHGLLTVGTTPGQAFRRMFYLERACQIQVDALAGGATLVTPPPDVCEHTARQFEGDHSDDDYGDAAAPDLVWDAMLRLVERIAPDYKD